MDRVVIDSNLRAQALDQIASDLRNNKIRIPGPAARDLSDKVLDEALMGAVAFHGENAPEVRPINLVPSQIGTSVRRQVSENHDKLAKLRADSHREKLVGFLTISGVEKTTAAKIVDNHILKT